jgi:hypothetical protein
MSLSPMMPMPPAEDADAGPEVAVDSHGQLKQQRPHHPFTGDAPLPIVFSMRCTALRHEQQRREQNQIWHQFAEERGRSQRNNNAPVIPPPGRAQSESELRFGVA